MFLQPSLLEPPDGRGRQPAGVLAEQRDQRFLEVAGGDALEVEDRDQHFEALRATRVGRQNRRRKANAVRTFADAVTHARAAHGDRADAGHDLAFRQMSVAHQPCPTVVGQFVACMLSKAATSASTACASSARAPLRKTSVSGSAKVPGWVSWKTLVSVTAYRAIAKSW